jgi:predicted O-methyltransferase YrrM
MPNEGELHPHHPSERAELYHTGVYTGIEDETGDYLYGLVRSFKPNRILETGTMYGISTAYMARACKTNGFGVVYTLDSQPQPEAVSKIESEGLEGHVEFITKNSRYWIETYDGPPFDMAFLDSLTCHTYYELKALIDKKLINGPVTIHDTSRHRHTYIETDQTLPGNLDGLNLPGLENPFSRGWRTFDVRTI